METIIPIACKGNGKRKAGSDPHNDYLNREHEDNGSRINDALAELNACQKGLTQALSEIVQTWNKTSGGFRKSYARDAAVWLECSAREVKQSLCEFYRVLAWVERAYRIEIDQSKGDYYPPDAWTVKYLTMKLRDKKSLRHQPPYLPQI